jgi:hypothetical protein
MQHDQRFAVPFCLTLMLLAAQGARAQAGQQGDTWDSIAELPDFGSVWEVTFGGGPGEPPSLTPPYAVRLKAYQEAQARGEI